MRRQMDPNDVTGLERSEYLGAFAETIGKIEAEAAAMNGVEAAVSDTQVLPRIVWQSRRGDRRVVLKEIEENSVACLVIERQGGWDAMGVTQWIVNGNGGYGTGNLEPMYIAEILGIDLDAETKALRDAWEKRQAEIWEKSRAEVPF